MFCDACSTIKFTWPGPKGSNTSTDTLWDEEGKHIFHTYSSMRDLVASLQKGCILCAQIAAAFVQNLCAKPSSRVHLAWSINDGNKNVPQFRAILDEEVTRRRLYWEVFHIVTIDEALADILWDKAETYSTNTASRANFRLIRLWLNRCLKTHKDCALRISTLPEVPTRILDVGTDSQRQNPKLVLKSGRFGPYVALSHVWGGEQIITTTKATLEEHSMGIPWDHLSKTFQDAVLIARELDVQYLWIDSLCIVQDSAEDWEIESAKMGEYYRNALLTIAATRSEDGRGGCFSDSNSWLLKPCPTGNSWSKSSSGGFEFIRPSTRALTYASSASSQENPLEYRAWCFQERILSPRLLSYSHEGMSLLCLSSYASERAPEGATLAERMDTEYLRKLRDLFSNFAVMSSTKAEPGSTTHDEAAKKWYNEWYRLITIYSACQLTYQTDILPAISGMAKAFQHITKDTYLSGLWENDLKQGLLWYPRNQTETSRPPSEQPLGPSWSWTSIITPRGIDYVFISSASPAIISSSCCSIIGAKSSVVGRNPFGKVGGGEICVSGFLREISMPIIVDIKTDNSLSGWHKYCPEFPDLNMRFLIDMKGEVAAGTKVILFPLSVFHQGMKRAAMNDKVGQDSQEWETFQKIVGDNNGANCLLLAVVDSVSSIYKRVGVVQTWALYCFQGCRKEQLRII